MKKYIERLNFSLVTSFRFRIIMQDDSNLTIFYTAAVNQSIRFKLYLIVANSKVEYNTETKTKYYT